MNKLDNFTTFCLGPNFLVVHKKLPWYNPATMPIPATDMHAEATPWRLRANSNHPKLDTNAKTEKAIYVFRVLFFHLDIVEWNYLHLLVDEMNRTTEPAKNGRV